LKAGPQNTARLKLVRSAKHVADPCFNQAAVSIPHNVTYCGLNRIRSTQWQSIVWYNVFTPTRNAIDSSIHANNKEHTDIWKNTKTDMWRW